MIRCILLIILANLVFFSTIGYAENKWFVSVYGGQASNNRLVEIMGLEHQSTDAHMLAFTGGKELVTFKQYLRLEAEGQVAKHFDRQSHVELNALLILRWLPFPWDQFVDTSVAIGDGLSYAFTDPPLESENDEKTTNMLNYLMFEITVNSPRCDTIQFFARIHHRSGIYGLIEGVTEGSNFICAGIKWRI